MSKVLYAVAVYMKFTRELTIENLWQRDLLVESAGGEVQQLRFSQVSPARCPWRARSSHVCRWTSRSRSTL
jgi:hypothetical protein